MMMMTLPNGLFLFSLGGIRQISIGVEQYKITAPSTVTCHRKGNIPWCLLILGVFLFNILFRCAMAFPLRTKLCALRFSGLRN